MKARWLFRVFDAFQVAPSGWVLLPGVPRSSPGITVGDRIELRGGRAAHRRATVRGLGAHAPTGPTDSMPLLVELDPCERPLLIGAEVWCADEGET